MLKCVEKLETIQGSVYLIAAYSYLVINVITFSNTTNKIINYNQISTHKEFTHERIGKFI